ncbi:trihelix transcription factor [Panicum miliaceum]|uniref:Trihelix transcription factor n=1 Tax=Panicum miliaceum TaxID=4540 RepID=A0A3L6Q8C1_PANMI|nr:trihelix transcription factor [Panicum miliaceum]
MASPSPSPPAPVSGRRVPPPCWTPDETLAVARAYTARRLAVGREHLTSADWAAVAAAAPSKTARQCRHKVEKLRRRLRSSRRRPCPLLDAIDLLDGPSPPFFSKSQSRSPSLSPSPPPVISPPSPPSPPASPPRKRRRDDAGYEDGLSDVVGALRAIGEGFLRAEERRMEAARETQRMRMEMALRHLDAQRRLMDAFVGRIVDALE